MMPPAGGRLSVSSGCATEKSLGVPRRRVARDVMARDTWLIVPTTLILSPHREQEQSVFPFQYLKGGRSALPVEELFALRDDSLSAKH
ncbi:hypothetical protein AOE01nite_16860 [Acetobacter oeni]|uniref:Uncharacterized protein n=1 Tax=Acetobacter oeni TaxID=304077 RepID=A0A511XKJ2_9PROT|nr:hypothetical protein AOE01nite_16860 [Acetobacter oeni]